MKKGILQQISVKFRELLGNTSKTYILGRHYTTWATPPAKNLYSNKLENLEEVHKFLQAKFNQDYMKIKQISQWNWNSNKEITILPMKKSPGLGRFTSEF
jgi:predicted patatin/cPLA2 family phospholipase